MTQQVFDLEKKEVLYRICVCVLHVHFICIGLYSQPKVEKVPSVIWALVHAYVEGSYISYIYYI